jgi:hypothetical protein
MAMVQYTVRRNVLAEDQEGNDHYIALCFIQHENGLVQRHAIPEELIRYAGEGIIEVEVQEAALKEGKTYAPSK